MQRAYVKRLNLIKILWTERSWLPASDKAFILIFQSHIHNKTLFWMSAEKSDSLFIVLSFHLLTALLGAFVGCILQAVVKSKNNFCFSLFTIVVYSHLSCLVRLNKIQVCFPLWCRSFGQVWIQQSHSGAHQTTALRRWSRSGYKRTPSTPGCSLQIEAGLHLGRGCTCSPAHDASHWLVAK